MAPPGVPANPRQARSPPPGPFLGRPSPSEPAYVCTDAPYDPLFISLLDAAKGRKGRPLARRPADELIAAYNGEGGAMTTRENAHKMAEANKAFSHFAG